MTAAEREAVVERGAEALADADLWPGAWRGGAALGAGYPGQVTPPMGDAERDVWRRRFRAALAIAEPVVREACAMVVAAKAGSLRRDDADWGGPPLANSIVICPVLDALAAAIRSAGKEAP